MARWEGILMFIGLVGLMLLFNSTTLDNHTKALELVKGNLDLIESTQTLATENRILIHKLVELAAENREAQGMSTSGTGR